MTESPPKLCMCCGRCVISLTSSLPTIGGRPLPDGKCAHCEYEHFLEDQIKRLHNLVLHLTIKNYNNKLLMSDHMAPTLNYYSLPTSMTILK